MEERYVFREQDKAALFDKPKIIHKIHQINARYSEIKEGNTITILMMGHGRERYKEKFKKSANYSDPFNYMIDKQATKNTVRILSKAGKPKICAWDYSLCTKSMSSQDIILELSRLFFEDTKDINTFSLMASLSSYVRTIYPHIIDKIANNYRDYPEEKDPGSPGAEGYEERFEQFSRVLESLEENKFSQLKSMSHEKVFTIRPESKEVYEEQCERYHMEIIDIRIQPRHEELLDFLTNHFTIHANLAENYYSMNTSQLQEYIKKFNETIDAIYFLSISDYEKYYLIKFIYKLYFGQELLLSEIVECYTILGIDTINIIDNTCRVKDETRQRHSIDTPTTAEIEEREKIRNVKTKSKSKSKSKSKGGTKKIYKI